MTPAQITSVIVIVLHPLADPLLLFVCLFLPSNSVCPFSPPRSPASGWLCNGAQRLTANLRKEKEATVGQRDGLKMERGWKGEEKRRQAVRERERAAKWCAAG